MIAAGRGPLRVVVNCAGAGVAKRVVGRDGTPHDLESFVWTVNLCLFGTFNVMRLAAAAMANSRARRGRAARRRREHCVDRSVRGPDRSGRVLRGEGSDHRYDTAGCPRLAGDRRARRDHRARHVPHARDGARAPADPRHVRRHAAIPEAARPRATSTRCSSNRSSTTRCSTARRSASTAPSASHHVKAPTCVNTPRSTWRTDAGSGQVVAARRCFAAS